MLFPISHSIGITKELLLPFVQGFSYFDWTNTLVVKAYFDLPMRMWLRGSMAKRAWLVILKAFYRI
jgi:hypothetical protein